MISAEIPPLALKVQCEECHRWFEPKEMNFLARSSRLVCIKDCRGRASTPKIVDPLLTAPISPTYPPNSLGTAVANTKPGRAVTIAAMLPEKLVLALDAAAKASSRSRNSILAEVITGWLAKKENADAE